MTSRERISKTLQFEVPDRIGMTDDFADGTVERWHNEGFPKGGNPVEFFDLDIRIFGFDQNHRLQKGVKPSMDRLSRPSLGESMNEAYMAARSACRFVTLAFMEPFEDVSRVIGREQLLMMMAENANAASRLLGISFEYAMRMCQLLLDKGFEFDGAWIWGDLAYAKGPFFPTDYYDKFLSGLYSELCAFFAKRGIPVMMHCDGDIRELMPQLIKSGVRAIGPLESDLGVDILSVKREFRKDVVMIGGIDESRMDDDEAFAGEISRKFTVLKEGGGYIYQADSPIPKNLGFNRYRRCLEIIRQNAGY